MKLIHLTQGYSAMVDDEDFEWLSQWKWHAKKGEKIVYAKRGNGNGKPDILMHRQILGLTDPKILGEHADGNGLNNTRENIRPSTHAENMMNMASNAKSSSIFKGVMWRKDENKWTSCIRINGKNKHLGYFESEEDAARVYNQWAKKQHGDFARLNNVIPVFPDKEWSLKVILARNTSGFRGVSFDKRRGKWAAQIREFGKNKWIGYYSEPLDAAKSYDKKAFEIYGESALLNFPMTHGAK